MTIPIKSGKSPLRPAWTVAWPRPGYENTCSAKTAPANNSLNDKNCNVMAGNDTFFITWLKTMLFLLSPRAFANNIYSLDKISIFPS